MNHLSFVISSIIRQKGESQKAGNSRKIRLALLSCYLRSEIRLFALLPTIWYLSSNEKRIILKITIFMHPVIKEQLRLAFVCL